MNVKNPVVRKVIAIFLLSTAAWLIMSETKIYIARLFEKWNVTSSFAFYIVAVGLIYIAWLVLGRDIKY